MPGDYLGDFAEDATVRFKWNTVDSNGASVTRSTNGTINVYKDDGTDGTDAGVTDTEDFNSITGVHHCSIDTSTIAFYATGSDYTVVLEDGTIDSAAVNAVLAQFSIENRNDKVDVREVDGTAVTPSSFLDGTDVNTTAIDGAATTTRIPAALVNGRMNADVNGIASVGARASDLAEIAQYLIANPISLTTVVANGSIIARSLATDGTISTYSDSTDSQESIRNGLSTYAPSTDTFDGTETYAEHAKKIHAALVNATSGDGTNITFKDIDGTALWTAALPGTTGTRTVS